MTGLLGPLRRRGPDDEGVCAIDRAARRCWTYATGATAPAVRGLIPLRGSDGPVVLHDAALVHTRYAIIDLSPAGHQPFEGTGGAITAVFNGEVYNYLELRRELESRGSRFQTATDTEVLVEAYRVWGDAAWERMNGFWAVALYDRRSGELVLARDRLGVAPLYYRETPAGIFFASTIRSLLAVEPAEVDLDRALGFVETGMKDLDGTTLYRGIRSAPPATALRLPPGAASMAEAVAVRYWRPPAQRLGARDLSLAEAAHRFREVFLDAVEIRMRADLVVGCELSGGLDSSSVSAAAAVLSSRRLPTYTIRVPEQDEEPFARSMLERYALDYRVLERPEDTFTRDEPDFTDVMEEPYHSPNIYTHYQMRRIMKREGVGVVLSGSGGDEALAGYEHLFWPRAAAELRAAGLGRYADAYERARSGEAGGLRERVRRAYWRARRRAFEAIKAALGRPGPRTVALREGLSAQEYRRTYPLLGFDQQRLYHLTVAQLPYYLLSNDHFTMAIPLEHRFPFLDYRVVELGLQMPIEYLFRDGWTKYVLRKAMEPYLPSKILWRRRKMGFPFGLRPFLRRHQGEFEVALRALARLGLRLQGPSYGELLSRDPQRLWRMCSTGLWLRRIGCLSAGGRASTA